jgi:hypothetical protein
MENLFAMFLNKHRKTSMLRIHLVTYAGLWVSRENLGLPEDWKKIERWIEDSKDIVKSCPNPYVPPTRKNLEIPVLKSYEGKATDEFWSIFPKNLVRPLAVSCWFQILCYRHSCDLLFSLLRLLSVHLVLLAQIPVAEVHYLALPYVCVEICLTFSLILQVFS